MRVGDLLEWIAASAFVAAAYLWQRSIPLALVVGAACCVYFGQCYGTSSLPRIRLRRKADQ